VRIIVAAAGLELAYLRRTRVGGYRLPQGLEPGKYM
jgi:16S rRNA U516 pseudouridylate synthase RsuA-like enzyme